MEQGAAFRAARDELLGLRGQHDRAVETFRWPELGDRFNWGTDWFDSFAAGSDRPGLVVVQTDGSAERLTFGELATRSNRLARWLAGQGVARGHPVLVMLGNQIELWESMLALVKLGAVIVPTTTALGPGDLSDRIERSGARHVIAAGSDLAKFAEVPGDYGRLRVGAGPADWLGLDEADGVDAAPWTIRAPRRATPCSITSPLAPRAAPSWWSTPRCRTRWATSRPCSGWGSGPATST